VDETGNVREMDEKDLTDFFVGNSRLMGVTVSHSKKVNDDNYGSEDVFESHGLDFSAYWAGIPVGALKDPRKAKVAQAACTKGFRMVLGREVRELYVNTLYRAADRARQLGLKCLGQLTEEIKNVNEAISYDPFNIRGLRNKKPATPPAAPAPKAPDAPPAPPAPAASPPA